MISQSTVLQLRNLVETMKNSMQMHFIRFMNGEVTNLLPTVHDLISLNSSICTTMVSLIKRDLPFLQFESDIQILKIGLLLANVVVTEDGYYTLSTDMLVGRWQRSGYLVQSDETLKSWQFTKGLIVENNKVLGIRPLRFDRLDARHIKAVKQKKPLGKIKVCLPLSLYYRMMLLLRNWLQQNVAEAVVVDKSKTCTHIVTLNEKAVVNKYDSSVTAELNSHIAGVMSDDFMCLRFCVINMNRQGILDLDLLKLSKLTKVDKWESPKTARIFAQVLPKLRGLLNTKLEYVANEIYSHNVSNISLSETEYLKSYAYCLFLASMDEDRDTVVHQSGYTLNMNVDYLQEIDGKFTLTTKGTKNLAVADMWLLGSCINSYRFEFRAKPDSVMYVYDKESKKAVLTGTLNLSKVTDKKLFALYAIVLKEVLINLYRDSVLIHIPTKLVSLAKSEFADLPNFSVLDGVHEFYLKVEFK